VTEFCSKCGSVARRTIAVNQSFSKLAASDWNTAHYSPALGKVVKSNREARRLAKAQGMVEVGTEPVEKIHSHYDTQREKKSEQRYEDAIREVRDLGEIA